MPLPSAKQFAKLICFSGCFLERLFRKATVQDQEGCRGRDCAPGQVRTGSLGQDPAGPRPALTAELALSPASSVLLLGLFPGLLQGPGGPWGLAQVPQEPSMEVRGLPRQSGRDPDCPVPARTLLLSMYRLPTPCPKNSFERRIPLVERT